MLKIILKKNLPGIQSSNKQLRPDQTQHFVGPDLGLNCFFKCKQQMTLAGIKNFKI